MNSFVPEVNQASNFDPTPNNMEYFHESLRTYNARFGTFLQNTTEGRRLASEFKAWRIERGWGIRGKMFVGKRYARGIASRIKRGILHLATGRGVK